MTCESNIERSYYNVKDRRLKLKDICIYCGEKGGEGFLLDTEQLREKCLTGGYNCFPICIDCLDNGKTVLKRGNKNATWERKEKETKAMMKKKSKGGGK